eukprot:TRINITY_DN3734_c0_g1_i1.p1 TRINITY_DN3734_c0_g1~~TRINITY_DN3734_c0_g1_i1.p1  ORF type:complete len:140 (+),score=48.05 TRINITY_DN3734_c0_g1_i1:493-912(+)
MKAMMTERDETLAQIEKSVADKQEHYRDLDIKHMQLRERHNDFVILFEKMGIDMDTLLLAGNNDEEEAVDPFTAEMMELNSKLRGSHSTLKGNIERMTSTLDELKVDSASYSPFLEVGEWQKNVAAVVGEASNESQSCV